MIPRLRGAPLAAAGLLAAFAAAAPLAGAVEDLVPPAPDRYVTDRAGVLPADRAEALNSKLEQFEKETSNQLLVWVDKKIPGGYALEEFTVATARKWRAGQGGKNNGAILFVFTEERKMRIEVGYGLEGSLPDALAHRIQEEEILPRFRAGDYAGGIEAGVAAMIAATKGEYRGTGQSVAGRSGRRRSDLSGCVVPLIFLLVFIILPLSRLGRRRGWRTYGPAGWWTGGGWGGGGWGSGGGGGFSGGFSGGGGSFGGGGSSGSW